MKDNNKIIKKNLATEINKIATKKNKIYFFVIDTKGVPSGSLEYIYNLAKMAREEGYDVAMLHTEDEFVGVEGWLGKEYSEIPHYNVNKDEAATSPSDVLFIPEIYSQVMNQTKMLPCKRIAILQNYDYVVEQMPYSAQWGDFKIMEAITNTEAQAKQLKNVFPYVKTHIVKPCISKVFGQTKEPKKMIVNIVAKDQSDIKRIIKPFYWKHPMFKWVSFRELRGLSKEEFANSLREGAITIIVDESTSFCYSALESIKSGCVTICKTPTTLSDWMVDNDGNLRNCCVWFDNYDTLHMQIARVIRAWVTDKVPTILQEEGNAVTEQMTYENTKKMFIEYLQGVLNNRQTEMERMLEMVDENKEEKKKEA